MKRHTVVEKIMGNDLFSAKKELMERASTVAALIYDSKKEEIARSIFEAKDTIKVDGEEVKLKKSKKKVEDDEELDESILDECFAELSEEYEFDINDLDEEQLDELSNELLKRYKTKAYQDKSKSSKSRETDYTKKLDNNNSENYKYHNNRVEKRRQGIVTATNKINKKKV